MLVKWFDAFVVITETTSYRSKTRRMIPAFIWFSFGEREDGASIRRAGIKAEANQLGSIHLLTYPRFVITNRHEPYTPPH